MVPEGSDISTGALQVPEIDIVIMILSHIIGYQYVEHMYGRNRSWSDQKDMFLNQVIIIKRYTYTRVHSELHHGTYCTKQVKYLYFETIWTTVFCLTLHLQS